MSFDLVRFTDVLSHIVDNRGKTCPVGDSGLPLIATNCINGIDLYPAYDTTRYVSKDTYGTWFRGHPIPGDILFVCKGSPGRTSLVPDPVDFCIAQDMVAVRADNAKIDSAYLFAALRSKLIQDQISNMHVGTLIPHFKKGDFDKLMIPLPQRSVQEWIGDYYLKLSKRINLLKETNKTLEAIAQAIFKSWFIDFDPVRAKMEGRSAAGMDEETLSLFPDELVESELGLVPKGWCYSTVGESFVLTMGQSPPGDTYNEVGNGMPFYQGRTDFGFRFPTQRIFCSAPTRIAELNDTLVSVRAPVGDVNMAIERCCLGRGVASVRHPMNYRGFTFYSMRNLGAKFKTFDGEGTVFGSINKKDFASLSVISPSGNVLAKYDDLTESIDEKIALNELMIRTLTELRDGLLPRLISGKLRISDEELESQT